MVEIIETAWNKEIRIFKNEYRLSDFWDNIKHNKLWWSQKKKRKVRV